MMAAALVDTLTTFLTGIGLPVLLRPLPADTFLPGLALENGALVIDTEKLLYPGDILHEAGHLATMAPDVRATMSDTLPTNDMNIGGEMMAIAWSYAAALHLGLDPGVVFHADGYKGGHENLLQNFAEGRYLALPLLQWTGMTIDPENPRTTDAPPYPHMLHWLRQA